MPKSGQARVPTPAQQRHLYEVIQQYRHPKKNMAIMQVSFKLGLRVQEIALLQIKEVARLTPYRNGQPREFQLYDVMTLPVAYTKGANALGRSKAKYQRKTISFDKGSFNQAVAQIVA